MLIIAVGNRRECDVCAKAIKVGAEGEMAFLFRFSYVGHSEAYEMCCFTLLLSLFF